MNSGYKILVSFSFPFTKNGTEPYIAPLSVVTFDRITTWVIPDCRLLPRGRSPHSQKFKLCLMIHGSALKSLCRKDMEAQEYPTILFIF